MFKIFLRQNGEYMQEISLKNSESTNMVIKEGSRQIDLKMKKKPNKSKKKKKKTSKEKPDKKQVMATFKYKHEFIKIECNMDVFIK